MNNLALFIGRVQTDIEYKNNDKTSYASFLLSVAVKENEWMAVSCATFDSDTMTYLRNWVNKGNTILVSGKIRPAININYVRMVVNKVSLIQKNNLIKTQKEVGEMQKEYHSKAVNSDQMVSIEEVAKLYNDIKNS